MELALSRSKLDKNKMHNDSGANPVFDLQFRFQLTASDHFQFKLNFVVMFDFYSLDGVRGRLGRGIYEPWHRSDLVVRIQCRNVDIF